MGASLAADFPVEMASQPLRGVRSTKLAVQGLLCIVWYGRLVHGNLLPLGMGSGQQQIIYGQLASYTAYDLYLDRAQTAFLYGCEHDTWYEYQSVMEIVVDRTKIAALQRR